MYSIFQVLSCASYDYMKMCVNELQTQLQDLDSNSNRKLIQSAFKDGDNFSSHLNQLSTNAHSNAHEVAGHSSSVHRHNPFDTEDGFDRNSFVQDHYTKSKKARNFLEMHEDFGRQIREIMEELKKSRGHSDLLLLSDDSTI